MVNLEGYKAEKWDGVITKVETMLLRHYLETPEKIKAFKKGMSKLPKSLDGATKEAIEEYKDIRMDSDVLVLSYEINTGEKAYTNREFFGLPTIVGWGRSKLKQLREKNDLTYNTDDWLGKTVKVVINKEGYLRLIE